MPLPAGTRFGPYEIVNLLGEGGMGQVYRARDTRLNRDVAIKVLPDLFATDAERLTRFTREAQTLAALNHPNIATIYGIEPPSTGSGQAAAIVMELVDGDDLSVRIAQGAMPVDETLAVVRQIIDALEAAHDIGIVHRDLKPANIKLRHDGTVKVLDFGLAKAMDSGADGSQISNSPTLTARATQMGMIIGTASYMSPEQARGRAVDKRTDVWALGCVFFEMLTGTKTFHGEDVTEIISAVVKTEPDWTMLPQTTPAHFRTILTRCLAKDRKARIPDVSVVRYMLDGTMSDSSLGTTITHTPPPRTRVWVWPAVATVLLCTTIAAGLAWYGTGTTEPLVTRFEVSPPRSTMFTSGNVVGATVPVISPDGRWIAFTAQDPLKADSRQLYVRPIDAIEAQPLPGTDGAAYPFWSPDSRHLGFSAANSMMRVAVTGGPVQKLCALSPGITARGGSWSPDGVIIFNNGPASIHRVTAAGGTATPIGTITGGGQQFPFFLPDGRHFLFHGNPSEGEAGVFVGSLDSEERTRIVQSDTGAIFDASTGHLLFGRQGTLFAQVFDPDTFALTGDAFPVAERVEAGAVPGLIAFSVSSAGTLVYGIGQAFDDGLQPTWVDRQGAAIGTAGPKSQYRGVALSPDESQMAAHRHVDKGGDIWVTDLARNATARLTLDPTQENQAPVWSPRGDRIAFGSIRNGKSGLYVQPAQTTGAEQLVYEVDGAGPIVPFSWMPDESGIVFGIAQKDTRQDILMVSLDGKRVVTPLLQSTARESHGQLSPDGRWLAYTSNETGTPQVYAQAARPGARKWPISLGTANAPRWRADGRELYYIGEGKMWAVAITAKGDTLVAAAPQALFNHAGVPGHGGTYFSYAVAKDGEKFLLTAGLAVVQSEASPIVVVTNWLAGVRR